MKDWYYHRNETHNHKQIIATTFYMTPQLRKLSRSYFYMTCRLVRVGLVMASGTFLVYKHGTKFVLSFGFILVVLSLLHCSAKYKSRLVLRHYQGLKDKSISMRYSLDLLFKKIYFQLFICFINTFVKQILHKFFLKITSRQPSKRPSLCQI